jgi:hypothetical protein
MWAPTLLGPLVTANHSHWSSDNLADDGNRSNYRNFVLLETLDDGRS